MYVRMYTYVYLSLKLLHNILAVPRTALFLTEMLFLGSAGAALPVWGSWPQVFRLPLLSSIAITFKLPLSALGTWFQASCVPSL